ncbi:FIG123464: Polysaccharide export protein [hydrothermal vent metagenome]|uniref:FIG123464: Polysaccharide export protein n=1 Tax=hydrothermal vent metagenome TaxID=652676 RepID=A0A3B0Z978_9ZZZZ
MRVSLMFSVIKLMLVFSVSLFLAACAVAPEEKEEGVLEADGEQVLIDSTDQKQYLIGAGDMLNVFVWRNGDLSVTVPVRPDGMISIPLVEDLTVVDQTPSQIARSIESILASYIKSPVVTVIVTEFGGVYDQRIRIIGAAAEPMALSYRNGITLLDVMIAVGGLGEFAAGNRAKLIRKVDQKETVIPIRLGDLLKKGDISENIPLQPGDVLMIPETWF